MNVVDSSCWLEYLMGTETGTALVTAIESPGELIVPSITLYEVYKKLLAEKGEEYALDVVSYTMASPAKRLRLLAWSFVISKLPTIDFMFFMLKTP